MICGTILDSKSIYTYFGHEYRVLFDDTPEAKAQQGMEGPALSREPEGAYKTGDRVELAYQFDASYGLWYILGKAIGTKVLLH